MGRITINDLPEDQKISTEEMRKVFGGALPLPIPYPRPQFSYGNISTLPTPIPRPFYRY